MPPIRFMLASPPPDGRAAIAVIQLHGEIDRVLALLGARPTAIGTVALRELGGVDTGLVARWSAHSATLMPHAGAEVVRRLLARLRECGAEEAGRLNPQEVYPEAANLLEARMLAALAEAASPLAVDLLLDQPRRWAALGEEPAPSIGARSRRLNRLIWPPLVAALGPPNIGKSTLLNALAGRQASLVADQAGTTRDYVGATLDLGGLVVRYLDLPGIDAAGRQKHSGDSREQHDGVQLDRAAQAAAIEAARHADLVLLCGDHASPSLEKLPAGWTGEALRVGLRGDLGGAPKAQVTLSVQRGEGLGELVAAMREALVPEADRTHPGPWRFWDEANEAARLA